MQAGRIIYHELKPFAISQRRQQDTILTFYKSEGRKGMPDGM